jgi:hypothetical protein
LNDTGESGDDVAGKGRGFLRRHLDTCRFKLWKAPFRGEATPGLSFCERGLGCNLSGREMAVAVASRPASAVGGEGEAAELRRYGWSIKMTFDESNDGITRCFYADNYPRRY